MNPRLLRDLAKVLADQIGRGPAGKWSTEHPTICLDRAGALLDKDAVEQLLHS
jgi:hypothetical protein